MIPFLKDLFFIFSSLIFYLITLVLGSELYKSIGTGFVFVTVVFGTTPVGSILTPSRPFRSSPKSPELVPEAPGYFPLVSGRRLPTPFHYHKSRTPFRDVIKFC
jgi:hypothetical protein